MTQFIKNGKFIIGFVAGLLALSFQGIANALTQEELMQEAIMEKIKSHERLLEALESIDWFGDFRLRYEIKNRANDNSLVNDSDGHLDTARPRVRLRFGAKAHIYKNLDLVFRLSTGGTSSTSGNQTLGQTFGQKAINVNLAYASFKPKIRGLNGLVLEGGKVKNKFMKSEVVWDNDVNFEGLTESYDIKLGDTKFRLVLGQYFLEETDRTPTTGGSQPVDDPWIAAWQGQLYQNTSIGKFKFAIAFYDYQNLTDNAVTNQLGAGDGQRNSQLTTTNVNTTNIRTFNSLGEWKTFISSYYFKLFGDYAFNTDADAVSGNNTIADGLDAAWQFGVQFGHEKLRYLGDWQLMGLYRVIQQDAVFYALTDSDFHDGGTNAKGIKMQAKMALRKGITMNYTFYSTKNERGDISGGRYDILGHHQFDLEFKF